MAQQQVLRLGLGLNIQRSDGRIHSAVVSGLNEAQQSITVEWFEGGETKGKEVEVETVLALNENMLPPSDWAGFEQYQPPKPAPPVQPPAQSRKNVSVPLAQKQNFPAQTPADPSKRKSQCVKEIDKIKKNREERRQRVNQNNGGGDIDPSNPNWEFAQMIEDYRHELDASPVSFANQIVRDHRICVCVRKRPINKKEKKAKTVDVVTLPSLESMTVHEPKLKVDLTKFLENHNFHFDYTFDENIDNATVYKFTAQPIIRTIFDGGFATCFAYGQTGSGKTHTMGGDFTGKEQDFSAGIYAMAARDVFDLLRSTHYSQLDLKVSCSFFEIYGGKVYDLLAKRAKRRVLEDGKSVVNVVDLKETPVLSVNSVLNAIKDGSAVRTSGQTSANAHSSRSHAVFQIILRTTRGKLHGKFSLIDLAGNERGADTSSANRATRLEGAEINKSLLALKECIRAMSMKAMHIPFRASKLTQVLRDSFIGEKARTCMIATCAPGQNSVECTLNTLRYADRVKELGPGSKPGKPAPPLPDIENNDNDLAYMHQSLRSQGINCGTVNNNFLSPSNPSCEEEEDPEMYNFHQAVDMLQEAQDMLVDEHQQCISENKEYLKQEEQILQRVDQDVDYDIEDYARALDVILQRKINRLKTMQDKLNKVRSTLNKEEEVSKTLRRPAKKR
ncbi:kinesin-like protein KIF2A isoform X5 [Bolinopsis microptera]|uniref:kinesin-like protein KIF2A isoform X5 n=1 Tax=Bolinopsis microptera TaxID=2820187 RepID=UPI00307A7EC8